MSEEKKTGEVTTQLDKALAMLGEAKVGENLDKEPLDLGQGEEFRGVITDKYSRELANNKQARYIVLTDANGKKFVSAARQIVNALDRCDLYTPVQIVCLTAEENEHNNLVRTYEINQLIAG